MTLEELERRLPNGLHDAELTGLHVDYAARRATLDVNIDMSKGGARSVYEPFRVVFSGLQFLVVDPPDPRGHYAGVSTIDTGQGQPATSPRPLPALDDDAFLCWIFVNRWNGFVRIAARSAALEPVERPPAR
jgi:hypothetical protein